MLVAFNIVWFFTSWHLYACMLFSQVEYKPIFLIW